MTSSYQQQLDAKIERITAQFAEFTPPSLEVFQSPEKHFRMRAEFRIWHTEDDMFYAMFERDEDNQKKVIRIDDFPIADASINQLMPVLLAELKSNDLLSKRLFEVHFLATLKGEMLVSLIYRCPLDEQWQVLAKQLSEKLNIKLIGRSRGQKVVLTDEFVVEELQVFERKYRYKQIESSFTQPKEFLLQQNYPNPFNPSTKISWQSPVGSHQTLKVYDVLGNEVATLINEYRNAGSYEVDFNGDNYSSGVYFYRLVTDGFTETKRLLMIK